MHIDIIDEYKTSHLPLATYLKLNNVQLMDISIDEYKRGVFKFIQVPRTFIIDYNNSKSLVEPNEFAIKMSQLIQQVRRATEIL